MNIITGKESLDYFCTFAAAMREFEYLTQNDERYRLPEERYYKQVFVKTNSSHPGPTQAASELVDSELLAQGLFQAVYYFFRQGEAKETIFNLKYDKVPKANIVFYRRSLDTANAVLHDTWRNYRRQPRHALPSSTSSPLGWTDRAIQTQFLASHQMRFLLND